jgi:hypothetical protein
LLFEDRRSLSDRLDGIPQAGYGFEHVALLKQANPGNPGGSCLQAP